MHDPQAIVRDWLKALATLTQANMAKDELVGKLGAYVPMLLQRFGSTAAFCPDSLEHVASQCKFFPTYAELCDALVPWWREHRPMPPLIAAKEATPPSEPPSPRHPNELQHVASVVARVIGELKQEETEKAAYYAKANNALPATRREMTRAELTEAYKRAGVKGPDLPKPTFRVVPAHNDA